MEIFPFIARVSCPRIFVAEPGLSWAELPLAVLQHTPHPLGFTALGLASENLLGALTLSLSTLDTLLRGQFFHTAPRIFNSCFQMM